MENISLNGVYTANHLSPREGMREKCVKVLAKISKLRKYEGMFSLGYFISKYINLLQKKYESMLYVKESDIVVNVVTTLAKNIILDAALAGSGYSVVGPYMGLISSVSYTGVPVAGDTMLSHATWYEAGTGSYFPLYTVPRKTCVWAGATGGAKALTAALSFVCETTGGTVKGCFIVFGTGAVATIADTNGTLLSAGVFQGGDKILGVADTLQVSYSISA